MLTRSLIQASLRDLLRRPLQTALMLIGIALGVAVVVAIDLANANIGTLTDMIACPGLDLCSLANARTYTVVDLINERFDDLDYQHDIGELDLNISGCIAR